VIGRILVTRDFEHL